MERPLLAVTSSASVRLVPTEGPFTGFHWIALQWLFLFQGPEEVWLATEGEASGAGLEDAQPTGLLHSIPLLRYGQYT